MEKNAMNKFTIIGILLILSSFVVMAHFSISAETSIQPCVDGDGDPVVSDDLMCEKTEYNHSPLSEGIAIVMGFIGVMFFAKGMLFY